MKLFKTVNHDSVLSYVTLLLPIPVKNPASNQIVEALA